MHEPATSKDPGGELNFHSMWAVGVASDPPRIDRRMLLKARIGCPHV